MSRLDVGQQILQLPQTRDSEQLAGCAKPIARSLEQQTRPAEQNSRQSEAPDPNFKFRAATPKR